MDRMLTTNEVADRLEVSRRTVRRWIQSGELRGYQLGPQIPRVKEEDLEEFGQRNGYSTKNNTSRTMTDND